MSTDNRKFEMFVDKKIFLAPMNNLTIRFQERLIDRGIKINGFFDLCKSGPNVFSYDSDVQVDFVLVNSPNYWQEIASNFPSHKVFLYQRFKDDFISLAEYLQLIKKNLSYDVLFLPFNRSNVIDLSMVSRELSKLGLSSALIDISGDKDSNVALGLRENNDVATVSRDSLENVKRSALVASIDWEKSFGRPLIEKDRQRGIVTVGIVDGIEDFEDADYAVKRNAYKTVEYVLTMGKDDQTHLQDKIEKTNVIGLPKLFLLYREPVSFPLKDLIVINVNFTYGSHEDKRDDWLEQVIQACKQLAIDYTISQHHADTGNMDKQSLSSFNAYDSLRRGSLLISRFSTLVLESLALGKPVVYFNPHGEKVGLYKEPLGAFSVANNVAELVKMISSELLKKHDVRERSRMFLDNKCSVSHTVPPAKLAAYRIKNLLEERGFIDFYPSKTYQMQDSYVARCEYHHYDDSTCEDEWQLEVYLHALGLMTINNFSKVADFGCGSGYKLMKYLANYHPIGYELPANVEILRTKYPQADWRVSDFSLVDDINVEVLICSDVIEHLIDPDMLIEYFLRQSFKYLIISTPDRDLCYDEDDPCRMGPPRNVAHQREWNFAEFARYISQSFDVIDHRVTNLQQATQMLICRKRF
jgi:hypothetical protein